MNRSLSQIILACFIAFLATGASAKPHEHHHHVVHPSSVVIGMPKTPVPYTALVRAGNLEGHAVNDLYAVYLGQTGVIGKKIPLNCERQLTGMWDQKLRRRPNSVAREVKASLLSEYRTKDRGFMSLRDYIDIGDAQSRLLYSSLNWSTVGMTHLHTSKGVNKRKLADLQKLAYMINGRTLITFGETEIMPSNEGAFNADFLNFLLQHCGRRFVESIPAMNDMHASFGEFQFTEKALYEVGNQRRGASRENPALPITLRIPGSTILLRGNNHFRAAYLNAVDNLATFVRQLNDRELATLEWAIVHKRSEVNVLIGSMHHLPHPAMTAGRRWLDAGAKKYPFVVSTTGGTHFYASKTDYNLQALMKY